MILFITKNSNGFFDYYKAKNSQIHQRKMKGWLGSKLGKLSCFLLLPSLGNFITIELFYFSKNISNWWVNKCAPWDLRTSRKLFINWPLMTLKYQLTKMTIFKFPQIRDSISSKLKWSHLGTYFTKLQDKMSVQISILFALLNHVRPKLSMRIKQFKLKKMNVNNNRIH